LLGTHLCVLLGSRIHISYVLVPCVLQFVELHTVNIIARVTIYKQHAVAVFEI